MTTVVRRRVTHRSKASGRDTRLDVYTDGACSGSPGPGGWGWYIPKLGTFNSGGTPSTTNQRMELQAALMALRDNKLEPKLCIVTDSAYVMNCFTDGWHKNWKGGKKRTGEPVANWDIWEPLIATVTHRDVTWRKVKGHSGDHGNEYVDKLAVEAKKRYMK